MEKSLSGEMFARSRAAPSSHFASHSAGFPFGRRRRIPIEPSQVATTATCGARRRPSAGSKLIRFHRQPHSGLAERQSVAGAAGSTSSPLEAPTRAGSEGPSDRYLI